MKAALARSVPERSVSAKDDCVLEVGLGEANPLIMDLGRLNQPTGLCHSVPLGLAHSKCSVSVCGIGGWPCVVCESAENQVSREEVETCESRPHVLCDLEPFVLWLESLRAVWTAGKTGLSQCWAGGKVTLAEQSPIILGSPWKVEKPWRILEVSGHT